MRAKRCAFLTMENTAGWSIDAELAIPPLEVRGWQVTSVPWRLPKVDWGRYTAVYIGTPWDYPEDVPRFLDVLEQIDRSDAVLVNSLSLVRWIAKPICAISRRAARRSFRACGPTGWSQGSSPGSSGTPPATG